MKHPNRTYITYTCITCSNEFEKEKDGNKYRFCNQQCYQEWRRGNRRFPALTSELRSKISEGNKRNPTRYWVGRSLPRHVIEARVKGVKEKLSGENSRFWKGGITPENTHIRNSSDYRKWRIEVFERDKYTCVSCGDSNGGNLNADHIKPFSLFPEYRFDVDNGRTLCEVCHRNTESYLNPHMRKEDYL